MVQMVSHKSLTVGSLGLIPDQPMWGLCWTKSHWDRFSSKYFSFHFSIIPSIVNTHFHLHIALIRQMSKAWEPSKKEMLFQKLGMHWIQIYFHFLFTCRSLLERANYWIKSQWSCLLLDQLPIRTTVFPITESSSRIYCCTDRNGNPLISMY